MARKATFETTTPYVVEHLQPALSAIAAEFCVNPSQIAGVGEATVRGENYKKGFRAILCRPSENDKLTLGNERLSVGDVLSRTEIDPRGAEVFVIKYLSEDGVHLCNSIAIVREGEDSDSRDLWVIDIRKKGIADKTHMTVFHANQKTSTSRGDFVLNDHILAQAGRRFISWAESSLGCDKDRFYTSGRQNYLEIRLATNPFVSKEQAEAVIEFAHEKFEQ